MADVFAKGVTKWWGLSLEDTGQKIIVENGKATGVRLSYGEVLGGHHVAKIR